MRACRYGRGYFMVRTTEKVWTLPKPTAEEREAPSDSHLGQLNKLFGFGVKMVSCAVLLHMRQDSLWPPRASYKSPARMPGMAVAATRPTG